MLKSTGSVLSNVNSTRSPASRCRHSSCQSYGAIGWARTLFGESAVTRLAVQAQSGSAASRHRSRDRSSRLIAGSFSARASPRQKRQPDVIAPAPGDAHVAARIALANEPGVTRERERAQVRRLDVGFHAMQLQHAEGNSERELQAFGHVASTRVLRKGVITEVRA